LNIDIIILIYVKEWLLLILFNVFS